MGKRTRHTKLGQLVARDHRNVKLYKVISPTEFELLHDHETMDLRVHNEFITVRPNETPQQAYDALQKAKKNPTLELADLMNASEKLLDMYPEAKANVINVVANSWKGGLLSRAGTTVNQEGLRVTELLCSVLENDLIPKQVRMEFAQEYKARTDEYLDDAVLKKAEALSETIEAEFLLWVLKWTGHFRLEKNECSRIHKLQECVQSSIRVQLTQGKALPANLDLKDTVPFVVRHDWAGVMPNDILATETMLPYEKCAFEFKVNGKVMIYMLPIGVIMVECPNNVWLGLDAKEENIALYSFIEKQVRAICAILDAKVAEHSVIRQPDALNAKRVKAGKLPLKDYHVVDLSKRLRAERSNSEPTGRHGVRCHWRRGHWRHFANSTKTWINWMLVGDPDLGFIDKEYKL